MPQNAGIMYELWEQVSGNEFLWSQVACKSVIFWNKVTTCSSLNTRVTVTYRPQCV